MNDNNVVWLVCANLGPTVNILIPQSCGLFKAYTGMYESYTIFSDGKYFTFIFTSSSITCSVV